ncbi:unnamed protein product [Heterobilharzia americana]|nr:unnamed protein product [Heterobilharzia americana]
MSTCIITYRDFERALRLIKAIYRPYNIYCIHIDKKSTTTDYAEFVQHVQQLGENIYFVPDKQRVHVVWGRYSVLEADLICAKLLLKYGKNWKYFINLTGHEFPLRTNWELVKALKALNGLNIAPAHYLQGKPWRIPPKRLVPLDCHSNIYRNAICMLGKGDLSYLMHHPHFFANKFLPDVEPEAYDELERWLANKILYEFHYNKTHPSFLYQYYVNYTFSQINNLKFNEQF